MMIFSQPSKPVKLARSLEKMIRTVIKNSQYFSSQKCFSCLKIVGTYFYVQNKQNKANGRSITSYLKMKECFIKKVFSPIICMFKSKFRCIANLGKVAGEGGLPMSALPLNCKEAPVLKIVEYSLVHIEVEDSLMRHLALASSNPCLSKSNNDFQLLRKPGKSKITQHLKTSIYHEVQQTTVNATKEGKEKTNNYHDMKSD